MRKKKFIAMALVAMLSLSGLTGCSDKDKADISNKLNNKTAETTKKDDSKADDKTSESTTEDKSDNKKSDSADNSASKPAEDKKSDSNSGNTGSNSSANKPSNSGNTGSSDSSTSKPAETKPSQPAHQHTWVDHKATRTVTEYVHHDAVYQDVTTPAVTQKQIQCLGCHKWFASAADLDNHAFAVQIGQESGDPSRCGSTSYDAEREVVITPAKTEHKLVKDAWDEPVQKTETYVDYQYCSGCGQHK